MKKQGLLLVAITSLLFTGCGNNNGGNKYDESAFEINDKYYDNVEKRAKFDLENELNFDETFDGGMSDDIWYCLDGSWHTDDASAPHNGVQKRNLFYTKDSNNNNYLAIKAHGNYDKSLMDGTGLIKPEGGCIETQKHLIPGRYEIKMAAMPREGGVSAMWTYCTTTGNEKTSQNEIDIEIGGTTSGTQFEHEWCTSWTTQTNKATDTIDVTDILYMNDGKIHNYAFDWYTEYHGRGGRVDWFIDGIYVDSLEGGEIPDHAMPLWVGVWFPPRWAGAPLFEEDYMLIDEIKFTAFDENSQYCDNCRSYVTYNPTLPSQSNIKTVDFNDVTKNLNILSNSDLESIELAKKDNSYYGWIPDSPERFKGTVTLSDEHTEGSHSFKLSALDETDGGIYLGQGISNSYEGYKFHLAIDAKKLSEDAVGNIEIHFQKSAVVDIENKMQVISIDSTSFKTYERDIEVPANAKYLKIYITAEKGELLFDNARLYRR